MQDVDVLIGCRLDLGHRRDVADRTEDRILEPELVERRDIGLRVVPDHEVAVLTEVAKKVARVSDRRELFSVVDDRVLGHLPVLINEVISAEDDETTRLRISWRDDLVSERFQRAGQRPREVFEASDVRIASVVDDADRKPGHVRGFPRTLP